MSKMREAFEKWYAANSTSRQFDHRSAWEGYQAAMTQERDKCIKECNEFWGKRSDQDFELICALQASEQQLREALEICKKEMQGDKWDALYIDGVLAKHSPEDEVEHARRMV